MSARPLRLVIVSVVALSGYARVAHSADAWSPSVHLDYMPRVATTEHPAHPYIDFGMHAGYATEKAGGVDVGRMFSLPSRVLFGGSGMVSTRDSQPGGYVLPEIGYGSGSVFARGSVMVGPAIEIGPSRVGGAIRLAVDLLIVELALRLMYLPTPQSDQAPFAVFAGIGFGI
jgi:hypothetical protein